MATVATRIQRALRLLGVLESGATPSTSEYSDALVALNAMIGTWRNDGLLCYALQEETLTLVNGDAAYNIGPSVSADLNTTRPVSIEAAWIVDNGNSYEVTRMEEAEYDAIEAKTTEGDWPDRFLYRPTMPMGVITVYPVPNASRTLKLVTRVVVAEFAATTDTVTLPPGWERLIDSNLAIELAPEYQVSASAEVAKMARESLAAVKGINSRPTKAETDIGVMFPGRHANIYTGE
jgi:hypothetical protein